MKLEYTHIAEFNEPDYRSYGILISPESEEDVIFMKNMIKTNEVNFKTIHYKNGEKLVITYDQFIKLKNYIDGHSSSSLNITWIEHDDVNIENSHIINCSEILYIK